MSKHKVPVEVWRNIGSYVKHDSDLERYDTAMTQRGVHIGKDEVSFQNQRWRNQFKNMSREYLSDMVYDAYFEESRKNFKGLFQMFTLNTKALMEKIQLVNNTNDLMAIFEHDFWKVSPFKPITLELWKCIVKRGTDLVKDNFEKLDSETATPATYVKDCFLFNHRVKSLNPTTIDHFIHIYYTYVYEAMMGEHNKENTLMVYLIWWLQLQKTIDVKYGTGDYPYRPHELNELAWFPFGDRSFAVAFSKINFMFMDQSVSEITCPLHDMKRMFEPKFLIPKTYQLLKRSVSLVDSFLESKLPLNVLLSAFQKMTNYDYEKWTHSKETMLKVYKLTNAKYPKQIQKIMRSVIEMWKRRKQIEESGSDNSETEEPYNTKANVASTVYYHPELANMTHHNVPNLLMKKLRSKMDRYNHNQLDHWLDTHVIPHFGPEVVKRTTDGKGRTMLHHVVDSNDPNIVKAVIRRGVDVNALDNKRETALHKAAKNGNEEVWNTLIEHGAKEDIKNKKNRTPLDVWNHVWNTTY